MQNQPSQLESYWKSIVDYPLIKWSCAFNARFLGKHAGLKGPKYEEKCGNVQYMRLDFPFMRRFHLAYLQKLRLFFGKKTDEQREGNPNRRRSPLNLCLYYEHSKKCYVCG